MLERRVREKLAERELFRRALERITTPPLAKHKEARHIGTYMRTLSGVSSLREVTNEKGSMASPVKSWWWWPGSSWVCDVGGGCMGAADGGRLTARMLHKNCEGKSTDIRNRGTRICLELNLEPRADQRLLDAASAGASC